jgi:hypothetical protein
MTCVHLAFHVLPTDVYVAYILFILLGIAYSVCAAALWPCVAYAVPPKQLGTA